MEKLPQRSCSLSAEDRDPSMETLLSTGDDEDSTSWLKIHDHARSMRFALHFSLLLFLGSLVILALSLWTILHGTNAVADNHRLRLTSHYSPWFDYMHIPTKEVRMNGSLANTPAQIFRLPPSAEADAAWQRVSNTQTTPISGDDARRMGYDPSKLAKFSEAMGLGDDAYVVEIDVFHQIHCLNTLRMNINFMHYYGDEFPDGVPNERHIEHVTHCQYALLQHLMCHGDVDAITHRWWDVSHIPLPDFSINKQCRDFDTLLAWQESHAVSLKDYYAMRRPDDYEALITPPEFKEHYRQTAYAENDILHPGHDFDNIDWDCYHSSEVRCQGRGGFFNYDYNKPHGGREDQSQSDRRWGWLRNE